MKPLHLADLPKAFSATSERKGLCFASYIMFFVSRNEPEAALPWSVIFVLHILKDIFAVLADLEFEANRSADVFDRGFASKIQLLRHCTAPCNLTPAQVGLRTAHPSSPSAAHARGKRWKKQKCFVIMSRSVDSINRMKFGTFSLRRHAPIRTARDSVESLEIPNT